eukprot:TRINITY_DN4496_c0_g1_i1.p1 TRINITY_DN4496_c0_g1~~TRINITY_DN4496_c0_g1_i1.p1  ORF type:complete len:360 (-),score=38.75 TRINITY_DN4496_c0_g1_i1:114-1193(-)
MRGFPWLLAALCLSSSAAIRVSDESDAAVIANTSVSTRTPGSCGSSEFCCLCRPYRYRLSCMKPKRAVSVDAKKWNGISDLCCEKMSLKVAMATSPDWWNWYNAASCFELSDNEACYNEVKQSNPFYRMGQWARLKTEAFTMDNCRQVLDEGWKGFQGLVTSKKAWWTFFKLSAGISLVVAGIVFPQAALTILAVGALWNLIKTGIDVGVQVHENKPGSQIFATAMFNIVVGTGLVAAGVDNDFFTNFLDTEWWDMFAETCVGMRESFSALVDVDDSLRMQKEPRLMLPPAMVAQAMSGTTPDGRPIQLESDGTGEPVPEDIKQLGITATDETIKYLSCGVIQSVDVSGTGGSACTFNK